MKSNFLALYQIIFAYDGTEFLGSQRQAQGPTTQGALETALRRLGWQETSLPLAGRTDTGVHAQGQVAACNLEWPHPPEALARALNAHLPASMAVTQVRVAHPNFHPRYSAISRRYAYRLFFQPLRQPLRERYAWRIWPPAATELLPQTAALLCGTHDFADFGTPPRPQSPTVRTVLQAQWLPQAEDEWRFEVCANAFLYRMVRRMVFLQLAVSQGKLPLATFAQTLQTPGSGRLPAGLAAPQGLTLLSVQYPDDLDKSQSSL